MRKMSVLTLLFMMFSGAAQAETIKATVNGLVCAFCATGIEKTFKAQAAVDVVKVDLDNKLVTINTKPQQNMGNDEITKLLTDAGYTVTDIARDK